MNRTLVIVGHGMVGHRLAEEVLALDEDGQWRIVILAEENDPAYDRVGLSGYLDGKSKAHLTLAGRDFLNHPRVDVRLGCSATGGVPADRTIRTADGETLAYDALVLATGSRPFVPPVPGHDLPGCFVYRTFDDLDAIRAAARPGRDGLVVGGGLLGLEAANALRLLGMRPHVVETGPHLMPAQLDAGAAEVLHQHVTGLGVAVHCGTAIAGIAPHTDRTIRSATLANGTVVETPLVVFAAGVRPRDELAPALGLERADRGGILTDGYCRTSEERIWAVGECAALQGRSYGLAAPGYRMAGSIARQLLGQETEPLGDIDTSTTLKLLGVSVATFGTTRHEGAMAAVFAEDTRYAKALLHPDTGALLGGILAGETGSRSALQPFIGQPPPADLEQLLLPT
ncbi:NAD(P)/FAD-dependent oxidoreductase [Streptomyces roseochromogenus]|uniref:FAD/NAD(P)-binding domain-containing protein n=1 Tax=Streptomyces roseochromogenus subsp. oscitans DS 12.976 TaxID=1352936 RepID=V6KVJ6_STRRC|nr:FAD-dependent oxidoreductase [Streptomyces roseochromogenus]EST35461.1 hypothetical protein M878_05770 [Streptomyces roseochromogenus subsp. oscitans DS 12.976]